MYTAGLNNDVMSWNQLQGDASIVSFHGGFTQHFRQSRDTFSVRTYVASRLSFAPSVFHSYIHACVAAPYAPPPIYDEYTMDKQQSDSQFHETCIEC